MPRQRRAPASTGSPQPFPEDKGCWEGFLKLLGGPRFLLRGGAAHDVCHVWARLPFRMASWASLI